MSTAKSKSSERMADIDGLLDQRRSGDFYRTADALSPDDRNVLMNVRSFAEERVAPIINDEALEAPDTRNHPVYRCARFTLGCTAPRKD